MATWCKELTHWKTPWCWERLKVGGDKNDRGWDGWMASLTQWTWVWVNSGSRWWGGPVHCSSWGRKESDTTEWLNWTEKCILLAWLVIANKEIKCNQQKVLRYFKRWHKMRGKRAKNRWEKWKANSKITDFILTISLISSNTNGLNILFQR